MPKEREPPYIAAGFRFDAQKLIDRFAAKKSLRFSDFAEEWRDLNFSTIFMGRESVRELTEFIEECYRNALLLMDVTDPFRKVGVVYLLYSLYKKQPPFLLKSQIQIRVSRQQAFEIYNLENIFANISTSRDNIADLVYIVAKLFKEEALHFSCFPVPMGPAVPIPIFKLEPLRNSIFKEVLGHFKMLHNNDIMNYSNLCKRQEELQKQLPFVHGSSSEATEGLNKFEEVKRMIDELEDRYNAGLCAYQEPEVQSDENLSEGNPSEEQMESGDVKDQDGSMSIGQRRALLKAQQFGSFAEFRTSKRDRSSSESDSAESESENASATAVKKGRGRPKKIKESKRGRKKKIVDVDAEPQAKNEKDCVQVAAEGDGDAQAEAVKDDYLEMLNPKPLFPYRRPSKYPRPVRKPYFEINEDEGRRWKRRKYADDANTESEAKNEKDCVQAKTDGCSDQNNEL